MSKKLNVELPSDIVYATKESRELFRIRNSFTFNLGIEIVQSLKNPLKLFILPFRILIILFFPKKQIFSNPKSPKSGFFIIGVDLNGEQYSIQARLLAEIIAKHEIGHVTLLGNSSIDISKNKDIEWYRIPSVREKNKSRKEWNLMMERVLSSAISISNPKHVIYFGDYLYRGIVDGLSQSKNSTQMTWFIPNKRNDKVFDNTKIPEINRIKMPEFSNINPKSQSIHRILRRSESETIHILDISQDIMSILQSIIKENKNLTIAAIQKNTPLPEEINFVIRMKEIMGMHIEGNVVMIIDDKSPLLSSLPILNLPCLLIRTGENLSPIHNLMIKDLELKGKIIVNRRNTKEEINHNIDYLIDLSNIKSSSNFEYNNDNQFEYIIKWLKQSIQ